MKVVNPNNAKDVWLSSDSPSCEEQVNTMISREEGMTKEQAISCIQLFHSLGLNRELREAVDMVIEALSQPPADQWIPCSERLPKIGQICLVTRANWFGKPKIEIAGYWLDGWRIKGQNTEILAWMPLPEPYKGGGVDENTKR